jgi:Tfp pilus assembly protein PilV
MCSRGARHPRREPHAHAAHHGIGLVDTLVALLLLALSLLGACTMIVRTMGASHAAAVQTIAADLATDLAEDLRAGVIDPTDIRSVQTWRIRVGGALPVGTPPLDAFADVARQPLQPGKPQGLNVTLRWWDPSIHRPATLALQIPDVSGVP